MRHSLSIQYPPDQMARNKLRFQRHPDFRYADRVPVLFGVFARYFLKEFGINFEEYFRNAETQFYWQLQFQKWAIENIPDDRCQEPVVTVGPDFENVMNTSAFGGQVEWRAENPPRARPTIRQPEEVRRIRIPEIHEGFWAKYVSWWRAMTDLASPTSRFTIASMDCLICASSRRLISAILSARVCKSVSNARVVCSTMAIPITSDRGCFAWISGASQGRKFLRRRPLSPAAIIILSHESVSKLNQMVGKT